MTEESMTAQVVRDLAIQTAEIKTLGDPESGILVAKVGGVLVDMSQFERRPAPLRNKEKIELQDADSFIAYLETFKRDESRIFFDNDTLAFAGVIDFPAKDSLAWGDHVAMFRPRLSEEWNLWFGRNAQYSAQVPFGRFIEENGIDVLTPDAATLLEMVMTFEATKTISFREASRLKNGQVQLTWVEDTKTGSIDIPDSITIKIPVFYGQKPREIQLRFRYKIDDQKLALAYEFVRPVRVKNEAAAEIVQMVRAETSLPVHMGKRGALTK